VRGGCTAAAAATSESGSGGLLGAHGSGMLPSARCGRWVASRVRHWRIASMGSRLSSLSSRLSRLSSRLRRLSSRLSQCLLPIFSQLDRLRPRLCRCASVGRGSTPTPLLSRQPGLPSLASLPLLLLRGRGRR
jgi:hypothetical protein